MTREELLERKKAKRCKQNREAQRRRRDRLAQEEGRCLSGNLDSDRLARVSSDDTVVSTDRTCLSLQHPQTYRTARATAASQAMATAVQRKAPVCPATARP